MASFTLKPFSGMFRSLTGFNYRMWAGGALVSNIGTWMQRTAQDWIVLTQLSHHSASAVGFVMALQFCPQVFLLPLTGFAADHFNRRKLLLITQASMGLLAAALGALTVKGLVRLWQVDVFALLLGCVTAFDSPARQTFVSELVVDSDLSNAVALTSTSFNSARMIGPAVAGLMIARLGTGWVFLINGASFGAVLISLSLLRTSELHLRPRVQKVRGSLSDGLRYVWGRSDLKSVMVMLFFIGMFGLNFPIFISTMSVIEFHAGSSRFGLLTSIMAIGSVTGALLNARREKPQVTVLVAGALIFGSGLAIASVMPTYWLFGAALVIVGASAQTFTNTANSYIQLSTDPDMRGRVIALFLAIALGGTPVGAPIVGWVVDHFGPRWALGVGSAGGFLAAIVGVYYLAKYRHLQLRFTVNGVRISVDEAIDPAPA